MTPPEAFVTEAYNEIRGREPEDAGLQVWTDLLQTGSSRLTVAEGIVNSLEAERLEVNQVYNELLNRPADPIGLDSWSTALASGQLNHAGLLDGIASSFESVVLAGRVVAPDLGDAEGIFASRLSPLLLNRAGSIDEIREIADGLRAGNLTREDVLNEIFVGDEFRSQEVARIYRTLLNRDPTEQEVTDGLLVFAPGAPSELLAADVLAGSEFAATDREFLDRVFPVLLGRDLSPLEDQAYFGSLQGGDFTRRDLALSLLSSEESARLFLSTLTPNLLGRPFDPYSDSQLELLQLNGVSTANVGTSRLSPTTPGVGISQFGGYYTPGYNYTDLGYTCYNRLGLLGGLLGSDEYYGLYPNFYDSSSYYSSDYSGSPYYDGGDFGSPYYSDGLYGSPYVGYGDYYGDSNYAGYGDYSGGYCSYGDFI